nr:23S rRNA (adenine(2503)-C(2))-methyltransferase RlmN [[Clostridium] fimetarium]
MKLHIIWKERIENSMDDIKLETKELNKVDIKSYNLLELTEFVVGLGDKKFRAKQIYEWLHQKLVVSFDEMSNLPVNFREKLKETCRLTALVPVSVQVSQLDGTTKYLFELYDGNVIESVLMIYKHGNSVCISSQVGCRMGCRFCASTLDGLERNLTPSEMLDQIYRIQALTGERVDNVVVMGSGEPFDNFEAFIKFIQLLNDENGLNISARNLTVSTCGLVPKIKELADMQLQITLAISLHAPNDEMRRTLMPIANKYSIQEIIEACRYYIDVTGRRITFEYSLVQNVNDSESCAMQLISLVRGLNCHINLIPVNPIKERDFKQTRQKEIQLFKNKLEKSGINVTIRREMGRDIDGACGQLRKSYVEKCNIKQEEQI